MEPGTKFCIDHPDIKIPEYADECPICNRRVARHCWSYPGGTFQVDAVKALEPQEEEIVMETFKILHEEITAKIEEKKKVRNGRTRT